LSDTSTLSDTSILERDDTLCVRSQVVLGVMQLAWWLGWDVAVCGLGWVVGWPLWRVLSLGRFPRCSITDPGANGTTAAIVVHVTGVLAVTTLAWVFWARG
jgi:hypothetical protein